MMTDCRYTLCLESLVRTLLVFEAWNRLLVLDPSTASVQPHVTSSVLLGVTYIDL